MVQGIDVVADIVANLPNIFFREGVNLWNREAQLVSKIQKNMGRGPGLNWTVSNGGSKTVHRGEGYTVTPATDAFQDDRVQMQLQRGIYSTTFGFTDMELATVASYNGTDAAADSIKNRLKDAYLESLSNLSRQIELDLLTGTGTALDPSSNPQNSIVGFLSALATSGTYAGQSFGGSTNPGLISNIQSGVGSVTRADIDLMFAQIAQATGSAPTFIMASPKTCTYLKGIADPQIRYNVIGQSVAAREIGGLSSPLQTMGPSIMSYDGVPIYQNSAWGASTNSSLAANADGYVLFGQERHLLLDVLPYGPAPDALLSQMRSSLSSNGDGFDDAGLPVRCWAQAKTAASLVVTLDVQVQMAVKKPNAFGLMSGVTGFTAS
jgi:hypothetical protein